MKIMFNKGQYITISKDGKLTRGIVPFPEDRKVKNGDTFIGWKGNFGETTFKLIDIHKAICEEVLCE